MSFVANTEIHINNGLKPIQDIQVGDYVLSKPESGEGEVAYKRVTKTFTNDEKELWMVKYWDDDKSSIVLVTADHPFWVIGTREPYERGLITKQELKLRLKNKKRNDVVFLKPEWVPVSKLLTGDVLLDHQGKKIEIGDVRPVFYVGPQLGKAGSTYIDFRNPLKPEFKRHWEPDKNGFVAKRFRSELGFFEGDEDKPEALQEEANFAYSLINNEYCGGIGNDYIYDYHNRKWPATEKYCEKLYQKAKPFIRKDTVYNFEVEDYHTYFVEHNGASVWVCAVVSST